MRIGEREIGVGLKPYVIAEIGVNHDGRLDCALELVAAAAQAGAEAVKVQYFEAERLLSRAAALARYQEGHAVDPFDMLRRLELPLSDLERVIDRAHELNLHAIVTAFSLEHVEPIRSLAWDAFKSASPDVVNTPLLEALSRDERPLIVSTGAAEEEEIAAALSRFGDAALHCVSAYPTPDQCDHLAGIAALSDLIRRVRPHTACGFADATHGSPHAACGFAIGYSDHTTAIDTGALAVTAGAAILEKHLTHDRSAPGPDHAASLDPRQFAHYVESARRAATMLGPRRLCVQEIELDVRRVSRQSITTTRALPAGHVLTRDDVTLKRPGIGLPPHLLDRVIGSTLTRSVAADAPLAADDVALSPLTAESPVRRLSCGI